MFLFARGTLGLLGAAAIVIGLMNFIVGPNITATIFADLLSYLMPSKLLSGGLDTANTDSEMRFYSVFWIAYGVIVLWCTFRDPIPSKAIYSALFLFFLGGLGRFVSIISVGWPDNLFVVLMWIELVGPVVVSLVYYRATMKKD